MVIENLYGSEYQPFTDDEARELVPQIRNIHPLADIYQMKELDMAK